MKIKDDIRYITPLDGEFPERLRYIDSPPNGIYVRGRLPDPHLPSCAIIGARASSVYGEGTARLFAEKLAMNGVQIISGMARGIDGIAQRRAIEVGGSSFGVLGCGIDVVYPRENADIFENILASGGLISVYPPGKAPIARNFPARNRIISALSDVLLVVEAACRSGTSITVSYALEQGKDIFAVPGRINDSKSIGCNSLIAEGAGVALSPDTILNALGISCDISGDERQGSCRSADENVKNKIRRGFLKKANNIGRAEQNQIIRLKDEAQKDGAKNDKSKNDKQKNDPAAKLCGIERQVYELLDLYPKGLNELAGECEKRKVPLSDLNLALLQLQIKGFVGEMSKNFYHRTY